MSSRNDPDLLAAVASAVDAEGEEFNAEHPDGFSAQGILGELLGYVPKGIGTVAVQRAMLATGITGAADLEERQEELNAAVRLFMDGFIIATRYAREHKEP